MTHETEEPKELVFISYACDAASLISHAPAFTMRGVNDHAWMRAPKGRTSKDYTYQSPPKHLLHNLQQPSLTVRINFHTPPRNEAIRPHQQTATLVYFPLRIPVSVNVLVILTPSNTVRVDLDLS